jgi:hypothetical protein
MEISELDGRIILELHAVAHSEGIGPDDEELMRRIIAAFPAIDVCQVCFPEIKEVQQ